LRPDYGQRNPSEDEAMNMALQAAKPAARGTAVPPAQLARVQRACRYIEGRIAEGEGGAVTLAELGRHCRMSPWHLQRLFKQVTGVTPRQYGDARRLERLRAGLQQGDGVAAATYEAGFGSSSRVYERADAALGMTPATYAKGGKGAEIAYASAPTPLGRLLVAATARGVCFVSLGAADGPLEAALAAEFPAASRRRDPDALGATLGALAAYLEGEAPPPDLPLDIRCTAFQRRVWEELRRIPLGETRSYRQIAERLGDPRAQRAVGRACATNPVALVVPCHRAVREDGGVSGYRWGGERKQALLALEKAEAAAGKA
jgi:AraC family transcriptional regulator of adaptative response/methylated-DNA-[protein]-cysteine methyltransferase